MLLNLTLLPGTSRDYDTLSRFHYRPGRPATFAAVYIIRHTPPLYTRLPPQLAAVAVLSWPTLSLHIREQILGLAAMSPPDRHRWLNANLRTISRVIVHPAFRSLGLATLLISHILNNCPTRYIESLALMGHLHPMFKTAGMRAFAPDSAGKPMYYLFDRCPVVIAGDMNSEKAELRRLPMPERSTDDVLFRSTVQQWLAASGEISTLIRFHAAAGSRDFEFYRSWFEFTERLDRLRPRTSVIVFRYTQLPLRGRVDDVFTRLVLAGIPDGAEYMIAGLERATASAVSWYRFSSGDNHHDLLEDLKNYEGHNVAVGLYPPWQRDTDSVISAYVPDTDGCIRSGVY